MVTFWVDAISILFAFVAVGFAVRRWHIVRDRHLILSTIGAALKEPKALWIGTLAGIFYLAVYLILGGKGGRIHVLFGQLIFNTSAGELLTGISLALLVTISMALFVYGVHVMGLSKSGEKGGMGLIGTFLAVLAAFCP
jgi:hypothetical protein